MALEGLISLDAQNISSESRHFHHKIFDKCQAKYANFFDKKKSRALESDNGWVIMDSNKKGDARAEVGVTHLQMELLIATLIRDLSIRDVNQTIFHLTQDNRLATHEPVEVSQASRLDNSIRLSLKVTI